MTTHPLQSKEWGKFREKTGVKVIRGDNFQLTIHKIPHLPFNVGYLPKGQMPDKKMINDLKKIGKENNCIFIQLEPNIPVLSSEVADSPGEALAKWGWTPRRWNLYPAVHPLFTKYNFVLDITKSEEELSKNMHSKTRYNIKVAQKHGVEIIEDNSDQAFEEYIRLTHETTKRQRFYAHTEKYHRLMWKTIKVESGKLKVENLDKNRLAAHLLIARYEPNSQLSTLNSQLVLAAWILFVYKDTLYYPYGASSNEHRETMASNLMMWEAIKFGKKLGLKKFDMWGALGPNPDKNDPWYGFHRFKEGYGGELVEYIGSYDLIINSLLYQLYRFADKARWLYLKSKGKFR